MPVKMVQLGNLELWVVPHHSEALQKHALKIGPVKMIMLVNIESTLKHPIVHWDILKTCVSVPSPKPQQNLLHSVE